MTDRKSFAQAAPPPAGFLECTISGYWQLPPADWDAAANGEFDLSTEWTEDFRFLRHSSMSETANAVASFAVDDRGRQTVNGLNVVRILLRQVHPEDRGRLVKLVDDVRRVFPVEQAAAIVRWLVEESTGKASTTSPT